MVQREFSSDIEISEYLLYILLRISKVYKTKPFCHLDKNNITSVEKREYLTGYAYCILFEHSTNYIIIKLCSRIV